MAFITHCLGNKWINLPHIKSNQSKQIIICGMTNKRANRPKSIASKLLQLVTGPKIWILRNMSLAQITKEITYANRTITNWSLQIISSSLIGCSSLLPGRKSEGSTLRICLMKPSLMSGRAERARQCRSKEKSWRVPEVAERNNTRPNFSSRTTTRKIHS